MNRAERERLAYDNGDIWETSDRWHARFPHVFASPNTIRHERLFENLIRQKAPGSRVLELGCGDGLNARKIADFGADYVYGVDVSERFLRQAAELEIPGRLEFANADASQCFSDRFDLIVGRSILHHIDYRPTVRRLYSNNLRPGGLMVFMEPLGSNPLIRLYTFLVRNAHTPDERSFRAEDIEWFRSEFPGFELFPFNLMSLYLGLISSKLLPRPDNAVLRVADRVDSWLAQNTQRFDAQFRHAILVLRKEA
jgi:SAM-dependent methyltransferase